MTATAEFILREREIATIAALAAMGTAAPQLKVHVGAGLNVGLSEAEIVEILNQAVQAAFSDAATKAKLADTGGEPLPGSSAEFAKLMAAETEKWGKVVKFSGARAE